MLTEFNGPYPWNLLVDKMILWTADSPVPVPMSRTQVGSRKGAWNSLLPIESLTA